jgi:hypothetical protein
VLASLPRLACLQPRRTCPFAPAGFIDTDECVLLQPGVASLAALLERYTAYGGVSLHWRTRSSGARLLRPAAGVLETYTKCCPLGLVQAQQKYVKSFVQPQHAIEALVSWAHAGRRGRAARRQQRKQHLAALAYIHASPPPPLPADNPPL